MTVAGEFFCPFDSSDTRVLCTICWMETHYYLSRLPQAKDFQGKGGPEDSVKIESERRPGDQEVPNLQDLKRRGVAE